MVIGYRCCLLLMNHNGPFIRVGKPVVVIHKISYEHLMIKITLTIHQQQTVDAPYYHKAPLFVWNRSFIVVGSSCYLLLMNCSGPSLRQVNLPRWSFTNLLMISGSLMAEASSFILPQSPSICAEGDRRMHTLPSIYSWQNFKVPFFDTFLSLLCSLCL